LFSSDDFSGEFSDARVGVHARPLLRRKENQRVIEFALLFRSDFVKLLIVGPLILFSRQRDDYFQCLIVRDILLGVDRIEDVNVTVPAEQVVGNETLNPVYSRIFMDVFCLLLNAGGRVLVSVEGVLAINLEDVPRVPIHIFSERLNDFVCVLSLPHRPHKHLPLVRPLVTPTGEAV